MFRLYDCVVQEHDIRLVAVAGVICLLASYTAFRLLARGAAAAAGAGGTAQFWWLGAAALATGAGVWATHFVAMLAFSHGGVPASYAVGLTALSVVVATTLTAAGFWLAIRHRERVSLVMLGGAVVGAVAIGGMHYVGMAAMRVPARVEYDALWVVASLVIGAGFSAFALRSAMRRIDSLHRVVATVLLTLGICGLHFTAMAAVTLTPDPTVAPSLDAVISPGWLATAVALTTLLILALALVGAVVDQHLASRAAIESERLRESESRFRRLADATFEGILIHAGGVIMDANAALCHLTGETLDTLTGRSVLDIVAPAFRETVRERMAAGTLEAIEIELVSRSGAVRPVEVLTQWMDYQGRRARVVSMRDITERREAEARIEHLAHHDALTGLPNRALFHDRLEQTLARAKREGTSFAVLCLDLDRFKTVNDLLGQHAGDALLRDVAVQLARTIRTTDTLARLGGDEFVIVQPGLLQPDGASRLARRLHQSLSEPFLIDDQQTMIGTSIGVAVYPNDAATPDALLRNADTALSRAKSDGRGTSRFFEAATDARLQSRRELERDLRLALARTDQLELYYQPLADCGSETIIGFEALARWRHPQRGFVPPTEFIPLAEESGLIIPLGEWALRSACAEAAAWPASHLRIAVNLSPAQFKHSDLPGLVRDILRDTGLAPERLELEVTEALLIDDTARAIATLEALKATGLRISLDDFGTGYSSLSYLQRFPFDKIKIDRSFVAQLGQSEDADSIVRAVIALGRSLRMTVTAEGVETEAQLALLREERCHQIQGYLLGRPAPASDLPRFGTAFRAGADQAVAAAE